MTTIYHGHASPSDLESCRDAAPSLNHGVEWVDASKMPIRDEPYIVDNGAYSAAQNGESWDKQSWYEMLSAVHEQPREPDFVVLPDVYNDPVATRDRHRRFVEVVRSHGFDYFSVAQPGDPERQVQFSESVGASGVFMGGDEAWKRRTADEFRRLTHQYGLNLHIGQPADIAWAVETGFDSMDTTSIVVNDAWNRLTRVEGQSTLGGEAIAADGGQEP